MSEAGKIFMLDDDRIFLELYQHFLESKGYQVFTTDNAYKYLMYGRELRPDVMFLDINMPLLNGWEVLQQISEDDILSEIPAVMLSVNQDEDLAALKGVAHFLYKPLAVEPMLEIVESYVAGGKNHEILLLEDYQPLLPGREPLVRKRCFSTHTVKAAKKYLQKNTPQKIAVRYNPEKFEQARRDLEREDAVRVDNWEEVIGLMKK